MSTTMYGGGHQSPPSWGGNGQQGSGWGSHDSGTHGAGSDTISVGSPGSGGHAGYATVVGSHASFSVASLGSSTLEGGAYLESYSASLNVGDTLSGGVSADTILGASGSSLFGFLSTSQDSGQVITNFVSGEDHAYVSGHTFSQLDSTSASNGASTVISLDAGKTTIELDGISKLQTLDSTHKS